MKPFVDSFWRAAMYCLHPRVIALSFLPLLVMCALAFVGFYFFWDSALDTVRTEMAGFKALDALFAWGVRFNLPNLRSVVAPLVVLALTIPVIVVGSLLLVAVLMTPAMVSLVAERRFPALARAAGAGWLTQLLWSLGSTLVALVVMLISIPLWLIPPLVLILPPLIWGWLTYRVMAFDALAAHASVAERREVFRRNKPALLGIGVIAGYLGAAPTVLWASGASMIALAPILMPVAIWVYTLVFAFSSLWFSHFCLQALQQLRSEAQLSEASQRSAATAAARAQPAIDVVPSLPTSGAAAPPTSSPSPAPSPSLSPRLPGTDMRGLH